MSPKSDSVEEEILNLDTINPRLVTHRDSERIGGTSIGIRDYHKEKRINNLHAVIHTLAFMIIIPFLFMIFLEKEIPSSYSTIVSIVIGFYFGKVLFGNE